MPPIIAPDKPILSFFRPPQSIRTSGFILLEALLFGALLLYFPVSRAHFHSSSVSRLYNAREALARNHCVEKNPSRCICDLQPARLVRESHKVLFHRSDRTLKCRHWYDWLINKHNERVAWNWMPSGMKLYRPPPVRAGVFVNFFQRQSDWQDVQQAAE